MLFLFNLQTRKLDITRLESAHNQDVSNEEKIIFEMKIALVKILKNKNVDIMSSFNFVRKMWELRNLYLDSVGVPSKEFFKKIENEPFHIGRR